MIKFRTLIKNIQCLVAMPLVTQGFHATIVVPEMFVRNLGGPKSCPSINEIDSDLEGIRVY